MKKIITLIIVLGVTLAATFQMNVSAKRKEDKQEIVNVEPNVPQENVKEEQKPPAEDTKEDTKENTSHYSIEQAISDNAQIKTIAFNALAFITGTEEADSFLPPGKVADFFGFQYMRDVDVAGYGHNTTFLTKAASNVLYVLTEEQLNLFKELAYEQEDLYTEFGYDRLVLIDAFRKEYEDGLSFNVESVVNYTADLYEIDGLLSYQRASVFGDIVRSLTGDQIEYLESMDFNDSSTWNDIDVDSVLDRKSMDHNVHVSVMTYASEFFSWYKGSLEADVYFCPERHGTYFGGFYMKDFEAMGDPDYFISTTVTADSGEVFLNTLNDEQRALFESIIVEQKDELLRIVEIREEVSKLLRSNMTSDSISYEQVKNLMREYGELEGSMSARYAKVFSSIGKTLTDDQYETLYQLRNQYEFPEYSYLYSDLIEYSVTSDSSALFD